MAAFGRLGKGKRQPDEPLQALRCPKQTRHDGKIFETYPLRKAFGATITYIHSRNIYCSILSQNVMTVLDL